MFRRFLVFLLERIDCKVVVDVSETVVSVLVYWRDDLIIEFSHPLVKADMRNSTLRVK